MERTNSARGAKIRWAKIRWSENSNEAKFEKSKVIKDDTFKFHKCRTRDTLRVRAATLRYEKEQESVQ
jgi:hypothetical protein